MAGKRESQRLALDVEKYARASKDRPLPGAALQEADLLDTESEDPKMDSVRRSQRHGESLANVPGFRIFPLEEEAEGKGMTLHAAEKIINGLITGNGQFYTATTPEGDFDVRATTAKQAAERLVDLHWREVCKQRARQQNFLCFECQRMKPLEGHHRIFRSAGRSDAIGNIDMWCSDCHGGKYGPHGRVS